MMCKKRATNKVVPGMVEVASFAAEVTIVARDESLGGEDNIGAAGNADTVGESLGGTKSPA